MSFATNQYYLTIYIPFLGERQSEITECIKVNAGSEEVGMGQARVRLKIRDLKDLRVERSIAIRKETREVNQISLGNRRYCKTYGYIK